MEEERLKEKGEFFSLLTKVARKLAKWDPKLEGRTVYYLLPPINRMDDAFALAKVFPHLEEKLIIQGYDRLDFPLPDDETLLAVKARINEFQRKLEPHAVLRGDKGKAELALTELSMVRTTTGKAGDASLSIVDRDDAEELLTAYPRRESNVSLIVSTDGTHLFNLKWEGVPLPLPREKSYAMFLLAHPETTTVTAAMFNQPEANINIYPTGLKVDNSHLFIALPKT